MDHHIQRPLASALRIGCALQALALVACTDPDPQAGGQSGTPGSLTRCDDSADCGESGACACGVCAAPCDGAGTCPADQGDGCAAPDSGAYAAQCAASLQPPASGLCFPQCIEHTGCGGPERCMDGFCVRTADTTGGDGDSTGSGDGDGDGSGDGDGDGDGDGTGDGDGDGTGDGDAGAAPCRTDPSCYALSLGECAAAGCCEVAPGCGGPATGSNSIVRNGFCVDAAATRCGPSTECENGSLCERVWMQPGCEPGSCTDASCGGEAWYCFPEAEAFQLCSPQQGPCQFESDAACPPYPPRLGRVCSDEGIECLYCRGGDPARPGDDLVTCEDGAWNAHGPWDRTASACDGS